jgi:hypothetical protein
MATKVGNEKKKGGALGLLPNLGRIGILLILVVVFLIAFIPLMMAQDTEKTKNEALLQDLDTARITLQKIPTTVVPRIPPATPPDISVITAIEDQIKTAQKNITVLKNVFYPRTESNIIIDKIFALAKDINVDIVQVTQGARTQTVTAENNQTAYDTFTYAVTVKGVLPQFHSFMISLGKLPMCQLSSMTVTPAANAIEKDTAVISIDVFLRGKQ